MNYEKLIEDNSRLIWKIASYFHDVPKNDLYQAGVLGLLKAIRNYKDNSNAKFSSYAHDYIFGEMFLLASNKNIKVSKDILNLYKKIENLRYTLAQKYNKIPSDLEIANYLNMNVSDIKFACNSAKLVLSIDNENDDNIKILDTIKNDDINIDEKIYIDEIMNVLNDEERKIIKSRYYEDLTQNEVARKLKMSQVKVSRYEKKSLKKMRNYITS